MASFLLYIGIILIVVGWFTLSWFAAKQLKAQNQYGKLPQKWAEVKHGFVIRRWICRGIIISGLIVIIISTIL